MPIRLRRPLVPLLTGLLLVSCSSGEPPASRGGPVAMRRLTEAQYRNAIADAFGPEIEVVGRFEPDNRRDGLVAVGSAWATITPTGFEQYEAIARRVAEQVLSAELRDPFVPCVPGDPASSDAACAEAFVRSVAPGLLRRPLSDEEVAARVGAAARASELRGDFDAGLSLILTSLLVSPEFLFRVELAEADPTTPGRLRLTDATLAARLSFLLWNTGPDEALRVAAARGDLSTEAGLAREIDRMLDSPRLEQGVRAFFQDVFHFDLFSALDKDPIRYPKFSNQVALDAREQTLRVVVDHLISRRGDYRALFTTPRSFMTRTLGAVYAVPVTAETGWEQVEFEPGDPRTGLLSHASFNMLNAHPGRSSPTLRGVFLRESLLCQDVPPAPADVDFGLFDADDDPVHRTARDRLGVHSASATCRNCHSLTDPIGLGLERFDGIGGYRTKENGARIDPSGELDGVPFADDVELGRAFGASPLVGPCLVENLYRYATGREAVNSERRLMRHLERTFEASGHRIDALLRAIALSEGFRTATPAEPPEETDAPRVARRGLAEEAT